MRGGTHHLARFIEILYNIICGNGISTQAQIGDGTVFYHHGVGCVVHELCTIGEACRIFGNVTIGCKWAENEEPGLPPKIGNNVMIGVHSLIMPGVHIGNNVIIAGHCVVTKDIPDGAVVAGVPAKQISTVDKFMEGMKNRELVPTKHMSAHEKKKYLEKLHPEWFE